MGNRKHFWPQATGSVTGKLVCISVILIIMVLLVGVVLGELVICGCFGLIAIGWKFLISFLVVVVVDSVAIILSGLAKLLQEYKDKAKTANFFATVTLIFGVLAVFQFFLILVIGIGRLFFR